MKKLSPDSKSKMAKAPSTIDLSEIEILQKERQELLEQKKNMEKAMKSLQRTITKLENNQDSDSAIWQIFDSSHDAILGLDKKGNIKYHNKTTERISGFLSKDLLAQNINELLELDNKEFDQLESGSEIALIINGGLKIKVEARLIQNSSWGYDYFLFLKNNQELAQTKLDKQKAEQLLKQNKQEFKGQINAINSTVAFIEFDPNGNILIANDLFLDALHYTLEEIHGKHHSIFIDKTFAESREYHEFWESLRKGTPHSGEYKRITKEGTPVWLMANYTPVLNEEGEVIKIIKLGNDITQSKIKNADIEGQIEAIKKSQAVIEFTVEGNILQANPIFLNCMGYSLDEIQGKHHQIFCEPRYAQSEEYRVFWQNLSEGKSLEGEYMRLTKDGQEIWLQATYTPVLDFDGKPKKVVKYATDITESKIKNADIQGQLNAVHKSNAIIEFNMDGTIVHANEHFLNAMGYTLGEIQGKHHSIFVDNDYAASQEYKRFWQNLNSGNYQADTFRRIGKNGKEVYIQASYNPILDLHGNPYKVVKFAVDITDFTVALKSVSKFVSELKEGNFDAELNVQTGGDIGQMVQDNLELRETLKGIMAEIDNVVKGAGEDGNLTARLQLHSAKGHWKNLGDSINLLLQSIAEPVLEFNSIISEVAKGNLTQQFLMNAEGDIADMAKSLNLAITNLNELLCGIDDDAQIVSQSSVNMLEKSESINGNTTEVASAISQMARGAQDQALKTDESSKQVNIVMSSAEKMQEKANIIHQAAESGQKSCDDGLRVIDNLVENMEGISSSANKTSDSINILTHRAEEIGRTLNVITDIASQTNLLALNAAIEAARAGDAGRGFAVVAEEIRKLAEDSRRSAIDIEKIIGDVQKDTQSAAKAIEIMENSVKHGSKASREAEDIFKKIAVSGQQTLNFSKEIQEASKDQKISIEMVVKNIEQIVVVAEETAAGAQEVASSSQQLNHSMSEITEDSNRLSDVAARLQSGVSKFKLRKDQNRR